jgi:CheY-like chemotaxis protein
MTHLDVGDYRVLLVEDNVSDAKIIKKYFQSNGRSMTLDYAPTADQCYRMLIERTYDLILLDLVLPDGDGLEVLRELRELDMPAPIIIVTGEIRPELAVKVKEAGADDLVQKTAEGLGALPDLALKSITEFHAMYLKSPEYREKRLDLYRSRPVRDILRTMYARNLKHIAPVTHTSHGFSTDQIPGLNMPRDKLQKVLNLLTHYKVLFKTSVGMRIMCPECRSEDVTPVFQCPKCGSEAFEAKTKGVFLCGGLCGQRFTEVKTTFGCNRCGARFRESDAIFQPSYIYSINEDLKPEVAEAVSEPEAVFMDGPEATRVKA